MNGVEVVKGGGQCSGWDGTGLGFNKTYISFVDVVHFNMRKAFAVWLHVPSLQLLFHFFSHPPCLDVLAGGGCSTVGFEEVHPILLNAIDVLLYLDWWCQKIFFCPLPRVLAWTRPPRPPSYLF